MKVMAVASGGGHWIELLRLRPAFAGHSVRFVSVRRDYRDQVPEDPFSCVMDATSWNPLALAIMAVQMALLILKHRPDAIITTGAAPGYFALRLGRTLVRAKTIWVDSLANVDELSKSGSLAGRYADVWLTQWPDLAGPDGPEYSGQVI